LERSAARKGAKSVLMLKWDCRVRRTSAEVTAGGLLIARRWVWISGVVGLEQLVGVGVTEDALEYRAVGGHEGDVEVSGFGGDV